MPLWKPDKQRIANSNMLAFMRAARPGAAPDYPDLYQWSIEEPAAFWSAVWDFCAVIAATKGEKILVNAEAMPEAQWFPDARLNFAQNLLAHSGDSPAIIFSNERADRRELSWDDLRAHVASVAAELKLLGVAPGDRVAGLLPNLPETVIAMLATTSIGAIWSSCSPDFGLQGIVDRFGQIEPKVLIGVDGYYYNGKTIDCRETLSQVAAALPQLQCLFVVSYLSERPEFDPIPKARAFPAPHADDSALEFVALPFNHPVYILYTSGTTGLPKSIVHGAGGTLLQHRKEHVLHTDIKPGQRVFYYTTCGWMMWHWLVSSLASKATVILYDGAPMHPDAGVLWRLADYERIDVFGTSAKYLSALEKSTYRPKDRHKLEDLKSILSTGSPLSIGSFEYVYQAIKRDVQLSSIAGGTDLISCFALGNPILPVYAGELQCRGLGMRVEVYDDAGNPTIEKKGELVCTAPFPSMPVAFWNDPGRRRYRKAYFERFSGMWCHGDYIQLTKHGGVIMFGRSDTVLNPGGVRIGTAEIYRVVEALPEVAESVVIGQEWEGDTRVVLFVKLRPGHELDDALRQNIRARLRADASPRHVPAKIIEVPDIPRTLNGKIVEIAVREVVHGREIDNADALANPAALEAFRNLPELTS